MGIFGFFSKEKKESLDKGLEKSNENLFSKLGKAMVGKSKVDEEILDELEEILITSDVGVDTTIKVIRRIEERVARDKYVSTAELDQILREEIMGLLEENNTEDLTDFDLPKDKKPYVIMVVGVNGAGKTTSIAKMTKHYQLLGKRVMIGAGDTFRAAAIEQLQVWGGRLKTDVIAHQQGSDPGAVAYDAYQAAVARKADVLIFDTAGRLHTKGPLIEELRKVRRVFERLQADCPHQTLLVLDATTGHNGLEQARVFQEAVGVNGVFLAKLDGTAKGGITVAIAQELHLPVIFIGTGEGLDDLSLFDTDDFVDALFGDEPAT
jgi:fused signal recognition particle receptor